ncbi:hypothetical protein F5B22DRAFT_190952 [Xylaria bambusicola]|uniref:uncharacterized protein n=1 Tax=Xylaria bambusicola TaxID=326684 RepID=UPI0020071E47|nr:uncharacterized protein F5B22DRAFT_190952 [Xylaria bambusicola]KAI0515453.1 hypothetical protein F5B22DRAFT_190952 [Xylaria bambusicola]
MLEDFPHPLPNNADENEEVAELVVTALGTSGTHYICWKTGLGEYRQRSQGLPARLQEWLFPSDGTTRDFATLQVILFGDDEFRASDKNGEIRSDDFSPPKQLRRALTINSNNSPLTQRRRLSRGRDIEQDLERPRSSTLPANLSRENTTGQKQLIPLLSHSRTTSVDKARLGPGVPVAFRRPGRTSPIRPRSIDTSNGLGELEVLKEQPTPRSSGLKSSNRDLRLSIPDFSNYKRRDYIDFEPTHSTPNTYRRSNYVDSSMQTDPEPTPAATPSHECKCHLRDHNNQRDSAVSFGMSSQHSFTSSRRPSFDTPITRPFSSFFESSWSSPSIDTNPIRMGRMQAYFRSSNYVLGAALHPQGMG